MPRFIDPCHPCKRSVDRSNQAKASTDHRSIDGPDQRPTKQKGPTDQAKGSTGSYEKLPYIRIIVKVYFFVGSRLIGRLLSALCLRNSEMGRSSAMRK